MLQKELAKRLKAQYDTKMDGNGWLEVSSNGIPLCRIKYNGQFLSNPLPCAPVSSANTACSVRMNRQTSMAVWTLPKVTAKR